MITNTNSMGIKTHYLSLEFFDDLRESINEMQNFYEYHQSVLSEMKALKKNLRKAKSEKNALAEQILSLQSTIDEQAQEIAALKGRIAELEREKSQRLFKNDDYGSPYANSRLGGMHHGPTFDNNVIKKLQSDKKLSELVSPQAMSCWSVLYQHGYVTEKLELTKKTTHHVAAFIAFCFDNALGLKTKWHSFEILWNVKNLRQDFYRVVQNDRETINHLSHLFNVKI